MLIYDGNCSVCSTAVDWIREKQKKDAFEMLPCQSPEVKKRFPDVKQEICMRSVQLILPDGSIRSGEKAVPEVLKRLKRYGAAAALFRLPGVGIAARVLYRWFSRHRYQIAHLFFPDQDNKNRHS